MDWVDYYPRINIELINTNNKTSFQVQGRRFLFEIKTWHGAIVPWGYPQSIVAAAVFHL